MKRFLYKNILSYICLIFLKILYKTYKIKIINSDIESNIFQNGQKPIYISWHQRLIPGIFYLSSRKPIAIIVSLSSDGDLVARIIEILGWHAVRGSSSKGGANALKKIIELANSNYSLGYIVDGPKGPFGEVKAGLMTLAKKSGMPLLPTIITADKKWSFNSWDKVILPKPFSNVNIRFEQEIYIPKNSSKNDLEKYRMDIQEKLFNYYLKADEK